MEQFEYPERRLKPLETLAARDVPRLPVLNASHAGGHEKQPDPNDDKAEPTQSKSKTPALDSFGRDLTVEAREGRLDPVIGREDAIERAVQILIRRTKNNPIFLGEAGVGKTAVVEGIAQGIVDGTLPALTGKRVVLLDLALMVAGAQYRGQFEERIKSVMHEARRAGNVLLFVDEIHTMLGAGGAEGAMDAANILKPALSRGEIQIIGATTTNEYRKYIEHDAALARRFQPVVLNAPSATDTIRILNGAKYRYEEHHKVDVPRSVVSTIVRLADRYIPGRHFPDKAFDVLDESLAGRHLIHHDPSAGTPPAPLTEEEVFKTVSRMAKVPLGQMTGNETARFINLEALIGEKLFGQDEAVGRIARALRRSRAGLRDPNRPIGSFLFVGPTGVGKTLLTKALAEVLFGDEDAVVKFDMSEYMEAHSVARGEERIQQAEAASEKESEIKRGDPEVLANLTERLKERKALNLSQVNMQMKGGALTLSGQVEKVSEKTEIREVAEAIPGIHSVNDYLQVRPK